MAHTETAAPRVEIKLFGSPSISVGGNDITATLSKRSLWLIGMLVLSEKHSVDRQYAAGALWPDSSDSAALYNLRQMLAAIRRSLGEAKDLLSGTSKAVELHVMQNVSIDVLQFDAQCKNPDLQIRAGAIASYSGDLLSGCDEPFAIVAREQKEHAFLTLADTVAADHLASGKFREAIPVLRRILIEDPYRESSCRALMSALYDSGEWPAALELYREFRRRLRKELNTDVSAETKATYRSIRMRSLDGDQRRDGKSNIPIPITELIGRQTEIDTVMSLLERCRLVTLSGAGGVGKTRLAIAVARRVSGKYLDGAHFVDLASTLDPQTILPVLATILGVKEGTGKGQLEAVCDYLSEREVLLVLDNCEHITDAVARLSEKLLSSSAGLHLLATSRQTVGVRGEFVWAVPVLSVPKDGDAPEEIIKAESVRLFLDRYRRERSQLNDNEIRAIGSICRRLDGLPLAIELAAARTNVLAPSEIEKRLGNKFALLAGGNQFLQRHQTLRACMEWSWELLSEDEKNLLMLLSVFRGGCNLKALESITTESGAANPLDHLASLIDRSLVRSYEIADQTRYTMLETVREFAAEQLEKRGRSEEVQRLHRNHYLARVESEYPVSFKGNEAERFAAYEIDHDNFRAAIDWSYSRKQFAELTSFCNALGRFWDTHRHLNEGRAQFDRAIPNMPDDLDSVTMSRAYVHAGWIAFVQRDHAKAIELYEKALPLNEARGDIHALAVAHNCMGSAYGAQREFAKAEAHFLESIRLRSMLDYVGESPMLVCNLADLAISQHDYKKARPLINEALRVLGGPQKDRTQISGLILCHLAFVDYCERKLEDALSNAVHGFEFLNDGGQVINQPHAIAIFAMTQGRMGNWERGVRAIGLSELMDAKEGTSPLDYVTEALDEFKRDARAALGDRRYEIAYAEGKSLTPESCVLGASSTTLLL